MKQILKKIYTILILIKNITIRRKKYKLHFVAKVNNNNTKRWYYDFPHWGFEHDNLEMVAGADKLCEYYAKGKNELTINISASKKRKDHCTNLCDEFVAEKIPKNWTWKDKYLYGRNYTHIDANDGHEVKMWICPVTLFVLGRYPKYIYVKHG